MQNSLDTAVRESRTAVKHMRIMIVAGGNASERESTVTTAGKIFSGCAFRFKSVSVIDPIDPDSLFREAQKSDFALNVCYGSGGEDGVYQGFFETLSIPYLGPSVLASSIGMNKQLFLELLAGWGLEVPYGVLAEGFAEVISNGGPLAKNDTAFVLKPIDEGDSLGISVLQTAQQTIQAINSLPDHERKRYRVEEFVPGPFGTIAVLRVDGRLHTSDAIQFELPEGHEIYDSALKLNHAEDVAIPSTVAGVVQDRVKREAEFIYQKFGCAGPVRFDFILNGGRPVYLEANTIPGFYPGSNLDLCFSDLNFFDFLTLCVHQQYKEFHSAPHRKAS